MSKRLSKEEVLALATEDELDMSLEEIYDDNDQILVTKDGELYIVGIDSIRSLLEIFQGTMQELEKEVADWMKKARQMVLNHGKYYHIASGVFINGYADSDELCYLFVERKANADEEKHWARDRQNSREDELLDELDGFVKFLKEAEVFGVKVTGLTPKQVKLVEKHNAEVRERLPRLKNLLIEL